MPESANPPPSDADLHATAARLNYAINVFAQPSRISIGDNEIIEAEGAWQWSVRRRGGNVAVGHSCGSPELAFDRALSTLRELLSELPPQDAGATGGFFTGAYVDPPLTSNWFDLIRASSILGGIQATHGAIHTSREF